jgi:hypothetical protein
MVSFAVSRDRYSAPCFQSNAGLLDGNADSLFKCCTVLFPLLTTDIYIWILADRGWVWFGRANLLEFGLDNQCCEVSVYLSGYRMISWFFSSSNSYIILCGVTASYTSQVPRSKVLWFSSTTLKIKKQRTTPKTENSGQLCARTAYF